MKVLLVRPHPELCTSRWLQSMIRLEPYAQELIAGVIDPPHEVRICDLAVPRKPLRVFERTLRDYQPDFVGFGGFSSQFRTNRQLAAMVRDICPEATTCLGGIHPSSYPLDCQYPELFDLLVRGDGVSAMRQILEAEDAGVAVPESQFILRPASENFAAFAEQPPPPLHADGIAVRPRRDLVDADDYFCICYGEPGSRIPTLFPRIACVRTSVGCPHRCSFCVVHFLANGRYHQRPVEDVVDEIAALPQEYIYFVDDETFINAKRMEEMARMLIERGVNKRYLSWARADTICRHPQLFELWKQAGLEFVYVGFESLEESNLDDYHKQATASQNREAREILRKLNLNVHAALMVNPDFDSDDFDRVAKAIEVLGPAEFAFTVMSPPPGTPSFNEAKDTFICEDPVHYYDCLHTILPTKMRLKDFYRNFALLYALGARHIPSRANGVRAPWRDVVKVMAGGLSLWWNLFRLYRRYDRQYW